MGCKESNQTNKQKYQISLSGVQEFFICVFIYLDTLIMWAVLAQTSLHICAGLPEP